MRLSYAQNLEDTHLDLIFEGEPPGTYVDVGGGHPVADNVTFWLYLKGWRGLVVEPQAALAATHRQVRPRDIVYEGLAGARDGESEFHLVEGLHGLSSMVRSVAEDAKRFGASIRSTRMTIRRLDGLLRESGLARIDVLKIDVEGGEAEVLAGIDLARDRPRLLLIEAVNPSNPDAEKAPWEPALLAAGYDFVLGDGLNRFYIAREDAALKARVPAKAETWDAVAHLWDHGHAPRNANHVDHGLARVIEKGIMAELPHLPPELIARLIRRGLGLAPDAPLAPDPIKRLLGAAEFPGSAPIPATMAELLASDRFRAALGRIACFYDGGHIVEDGAPSAPADPPST